VSYLLQTTVEKLKSLKQQLRVFCLSLVLLSHTSVVTPSLMFLDSLHALLQRPLVGQNPDTVF
jgi:hypothetical protein